MLLVPVGFLISTLLLPYKIMDVKDIEFPAYFPICFCDGIGSFLI